MISDGRPEPCEEQVYIFDWKPCEKAHTKSACEPAFHPNPAGDLGQCEICESIERQLNPERRVDDSSIYQVHSPGRRPPSYAPPPYVAPPPYFHSSASSLARPARTATASTHLQLPPMPHFVESPYADGFKRRRNTAVVNCTTVQQQQQPPPPTTSHSLHSSAADDSLNSRVALNTTTIDASSLLRPPPVPTFLESPYVSAQSISISTSSRNSEQQPIQNLPPVAHPFNYRRLDDDRFNEGESTLEPRSLGLRSQWYENELQSQKPSAWKSVSGWIRKTSDKMTGQRRTHQETTQRSRSENLARQPRVKPRRAAIDTWVAASSSFDHIGQSAPLTC